MSSSLVDSLLASDTSGLRVPKPLQRDLSGGVECSNRIDDLFVSHRQPVEWLKSFTNRLP